MNELEKINKEAEGLYPEIIERDFNPMSDGSYDINESARKAYKKGASTRIPLLAEIERMKSKVKELERDIESLYEEVTEQDGDMNVQGMLQTLQKDKEELTQSKD